MSDHEFDSPRCTADTICFRYAGDRLEILLIERKYDPFAGHWAFPGGFIEPDETTIDAARRELAEETGLRPDRFRQFRTYGGPDRDPRGPVVTVCYRALLTPDCGKGTAASDARRVQWFPAFDPPDLAFDHDRILHDALGELRERFTRTPDAMDLLKDPFRIGRLHELFEHVLDTSIPFDDFYQQLDRLGVLSPDFDEEACPSREDERYTLNRKRFRDVCRSRMPLRV